MRSLAGLNEQFCNEKQPQKSDNKIVLLNPNSFLGSNFPNRSAIPSSVSSNRLKNSLILKE